MNKNDGIEVLLKFLRRSVFKAAIPDLGHHMDEFFFRFRRRRRERVWQSTL